MWIPPEDHKAVGRILSQARKDRGVTQVEMARRLGKPQSFVSSYEAGQRRVDVLELLRIAQALDLSAEDLFSAMAATTAEK
ncbi:anaerobic benzoate catabolism transcriptional regulator [mine drainage metagenome]|uniref:Anaerobic benzoate catabolism transcriptional regulator n=1 Tax=mine drainage metagenome TaxID=410659 RepID=A0A1J5SNP9_9ZZZZ